MRFKGLDLNLLVALDVLLSERNVTAAAEKLHLSQSAMSGALARLREYFRDDLLVQEGRRMVLTPRAFSLMAPVHAALLQIEATVAAPPDFDPQTCDRRFVVEASDYVCEVLLGRVSQRMAELAPKATLVVAPRGINPEIALESGEIDLLITPDFYASPNHPSELLFEDDFVVLGWAGNEALCDPLTRDMFYQLGHVSTAFGRSAEPSFGERHLPREDRVRRVEVTVPSFLEAVPFLINSSRIMLLHRRFARSLTRYLPLRAVEPPFALPSLREVIQIHRIRAADPSFRWLAGLLQECVAE
jgi:DNA-binding transcriptional LysR family regulator